MKTVVCLLHLAMAATLGAMMIWGAPVCAQGTVIAITLAQGVCSAVR
ncbi:MAG: hypothetical protein ACFB03_15220 [Paracoccaceae bacterium]